MAAEQNCGPKLVPLPHGLESFCGESDWAKHTPRKISLSSELFAPPSPEISAWAASSLGMLPPGLPAPPGLETSGLAVGDLLRAYACEQMSPVSTASTVASAESAAEVAFQNRVLEQVVLPEAQPLTEEAVPPFERMTSEQTGAWDTQVLCGLSECGDDEQLEAILKPVLQDTLGQSKGKGGTNESCARWWTVLQEGVPLLCPLTRFPICLLPYPPFKLRVDPKHPSPHRLVDGKFLAMRCIVTGQFEACGRDLQNSDISALDDYVHRCKLGQYRPGRVAVLTKDASDGTTAEQRSKASKELERLVDAARAEIAKLRRIQENRFLQISKALPARAQAILKGPRQSSTEKDSSPKSPAKTSSGRGRLSSLGSASTRASISSGASDISLQSE